MLGKRSYCIESHPFMNSRTNYVSWLTACAKSCKSITTTQVKVTVNEDLVYFACGTSLETQDNMTFPFHNLNSRVWLWLITMRLAMPYFHVSGMI